MSPLEFMQRQAAPVTDILSRPREASASDCFYEDLFVKPLLTSASMGASWAPHEGVADAS